MTPANESRLNPVTETARVISARRWPILGLFLTIVTGLGAYGFFWPPTYEARQRFLLKVDRDDPIVTPDQNPALRTYARLPVPEDDLNSEAAILESEPVLRKTVEMTGLDRAPVHWLVQIVDWPFETARRVYNSWHGRPNSDSLTRAVERLGKKTEVTPERRSAILVVTVRWGDPRAALKILETLTENYLSHHLEARKAPESATFFQEQVDRRRQELAAIDAQIAAVGAGATLNGIELEQDLALRHLAQADSEWRKARAAELESQARVRSLAEQTSQAPERVVGAERGVVNDVSVGNLRYRILELQMRVTELQGKYLPEHRLVKEAEDALAEAKTMLDKALEEPLVERTVQVNSVAQALQRDRVLAMEELKGRTALATALGRDVSTMHAKAEGLKQQAVTLATLYREKGGIEDSLVIYEKRLEEARALAAMNRLRIVNVVPVEPAAAGFAPVKPDTGRLVKIGIPLALLISIAFGFALELGWFRDMGNAVKSGRRAPKVWRIRIVLPSHSRKVKVESDERPTEV